MAGWQSAGLPKYSEIDQQICQSGLPNENAIDLDQHPGRRQDRRHRISEEKNAAE